MQCHEQCFSSMEDIKHGLERVFHDCHSVEQMVSPIEGRTEAPATSTGVPRLIKANGRAVDLLPKSRDHGLWRQAGEEEEEGMLLVCCGLQDGTVSCRRRSCRQS